MKTLESIFEAVGFVVCVGAFMVFMGWIVSSIFGFFFPEPAKVPEITWQTIEEYQKEQWSVVVIPIDSDDRGEGNKTRVTCNVDEYYFRTTQTVDKNVVEITCEKRHDR